MRIFPVLAFIAVIITSSCSTQPLLSKEAEGLIEYGQAITLLKTEPKKSCDIFLALSEKKEFVLADAAYVRSLQNCDSSTHVFNWERPVPAWLEKEKALVYFTTLKTAVEKALYVQKNPSYFLTPDRVQMYQAAVASAEISPNDKQVLQDSLYSLAPRFNPKPDDKDLFKIVKDYRSVRDFGKAKALLAKILAGSQFSWEEKFQAHKEMFFTLKLQKNQNQAAYIRAAKTWAESIRLDASTTAAKLNMYYEAQINYVRVIWTDKGTDEAIKLVGKLQKSLQGRRSLYEVYWLRARMFEEKKDFDGSITNLEAALKENISQWRDKEKILWSLGWSYFKSGKYADAERHLTTLIDAKDTSAYARFKYMYWKGEALQKQSKTDEARAAWEQVVGEDVFGYYNLLSHARLEKPLRTYEIKSYSPKAILSGPDGVIFSALQKVNEMELAARLLSLSSPDPALLKNASADDMASLFYYHALIHNYKFIFQVFNQLPYEQQRDVFLKIPRLIFPQPYSEFLYDIAGKAQIEPELVYSIMRQESSFDPRARSPMDAFGLLQILPEIAKRLARANNIPYTGFEDLYDERTNIQLGSLLLKRQINSFKNRFILYVASYNASSSAVRRWHERYTGDDLMFIEDIPYEETKAYVKLVLRNFIIYKKLKYGDEFKTFPRSLLDLRDEPPAPAQPPAVTVAPGKDAPPPEAPQAASQPPAPAGAPTTPPAAAPVEPQLNPPTATPNQ